MKPPITNSVSTEREGKGFAPRNQSPFSSACEFCETAIQAKAINRPANGMQISIIRE